MENETIVFSFEEINKSTVGINLAQIKSFTAQDAEKLFTELCKEEYSKIKYLMLPPVTDFKTYPFAEITEFLKTNTSLLELDLQNCNIGNAGFEKIFEGLCANKTLEYLNLSDNSLGLFAPADRPLKEVKLGCDLAKLVDNNPNLKVLSLTTNCIRNIAAEPLLKKLINNQSLAALNLEDNYLDLSPLKDGYIIDIVIKIVEQNKTLESLKLASNSLGTSEKISQINDCLKNSQIEEFTIQSLTSVADDDAIYRINSTLIKKNLAINNTAKRLMAPCDSNPIDIELINNQKEIPVGNVGFTKSTLSLFHWIKSHPFYCTFIAMLTLAVILIICIPILGQIIPALGATVGLASAWVVNTLSTALSFLAHTTIPVSLIAAKACLATVAGAFTFTIGIAAGRVTSLIKSLVQDKFFPLNTFNIQTENVHENYLLKADSTNNKSSNVKQVFVQFISALRSIAGWFFEASSEATTFTPLTKKHLLDNYEPESKESYKSNMTTGNSFFKASPQDKSYLDAINEVELPANPSLLNIRIY